MRLTVGQVLSRFRRHKPETEVEALVRCRVPLTFIEAGAFRRAYRVGTLPCVVKFPYEDLEADTPIASAIAHSVAEFNTVKRLQKKRYSPLHDYLPNIHYFNPRSGVLLMQEYKSLSWTERNERRCNDLNDLVRNVVQGDDDWLDDTIDCHPDNVGKDQEGHLVLLDLGCFSRIPEAL